MIRKKILVLGTRPVKYKKGYKYQLYEDACFVLPISGQKAETDFISLSTTGKLLLKKGYAWDGATGGLDTDSFMRGSLVHDALYQLLRLGFLPTCYRELADEILVSICKQDKMNWLRQKWVYAGVRLFASHAADVGTERKVYEAPNGKTST